MSTTYGGNDANFPDLLTEPSDGDGPGIQAEDVNPAFEGLADRTMWLRKRLLAEIATRFTLGLTDYPTAVTVPADFANVARAKYNAATGKWYACGGVDWFVSTPDPYHWPTATEISGGAKFSNADLTTSDFDIAPDGSIVVVEDTASTDWTSYQERSGAGTWTKHSSVGLSTVDEIWAPSVVHAPTASLWCMVFRRKDAGVYHPGVITSADRVTWTLRTAPAGLPDATANLRMTVATDGAGFLVIQAFSGTNTYFSKSTDGGISWSAAVTKALGFTAIAAGDLAAFQRPVWNGSVWMAFAANVGTIKIWTSPDASTWTEVASFGAGFGGGGITMDSLAVSGDVFVALVSDGTFNYLLFSSDAGVTWKRADRAFKVTALPRPGFIAAGTDRFLLTGNSGAFWPSNAIATPSIGVT